MQTEIDVAKSKKVAVLVLGMAGAGKTKLMEQIKAYTTKTERNSYFVNLDPAVRRDPLFDPHIDIRDTVDYRELMKSTKMGPNGAIMTSLNLFATKFHEVMGLVESREELEFVFLDTPGQIEVFTWSASGQLISGSLATAMPVVILYAIDTVRSRNATTLVSNLLYATSVMYRLRLPIVLVFTKTDLVSSAELLEWMGDHDKFSDAIREDPRYMASMATSLSGMLETVYSELPVASVSGVTGEGMEELMVKIGEAKTQYIETFLPEIEKARVRKTERKVERMKAEHDKWTADRSYDL